MGSKPRFPMPIEDRAKQFMPFSALRGLPDALKLKEKIVVPMIELSEEKKEMLDARMREIKEGDMASVVHYCDGEYIKLSGMVAKLDTTQRYIQIINTRIYFDNIYDIERN